MKVLGKEYFFLNEVKSNAEQYSRVSVLSSVISMVPRQLLELLIILSIVCIMSI